MWSHDSYHYFLPLQKKKMSVGWKCGQMPKDLGVPCGIIVCAYKKEWAIDPKHR